MIKNGGNFCYKLDFANKTLSSLLTAVLMSEDCCSRDHQLTYARSANLEEYQTIFPRERVGSGTETKISRSRITRRV